MNTSTIIILVIVIAIAALALKGSIGHFKGEGGCCDTGGGTLPDNKELSDTSKGREDAATQEAGRFLTTRSSREPKSARRQST